LVVEDSLTIRKFLVEVLSAELDVVGEAADGRQAIELCRALKPDVITLDMILPVMSGLAVTEYIMAFCPTPILIVSASTNRGELYQTYQALAAGALDVLEKPRGDFEDEAWKRNLVASVRMVSRIKVITHLRGKLEQHTRMPAHAPAVTGRRRLIAIGASTGGPGAVLDIFRELPASFPIPILLVMHISQPFATAFAEWLDANSGQRVRYAKDGERVPILGDSGVWMAPPDYHLLVRQGRLHLTRDPERHSCRPSVDVLFESVAREVGRDSMGVLLTGMGKDGALGLLSMRQAGAATIGQDEESSVVFGMPKEAIAVGAVERILPLGDIARAIAAEVKP